MKKIAAAAALCLSAAAPTFAATTLDFDAVTSFASIADFYNGGTDSAGASGPALGLTFGGDALALANDALGPYFSNAPTPLQVMAPVGSDATLNAAAGFANAFSFYYSATSAVAGGVQVWSGLDGSGTLLASFDLSANAQNGCTDAPRCHFDAATAAFTGIAHSVTFGNAYDSVNGTTNAAFDNVTVALVPEPSSYALMGLGLAGLVVASRRQRRARPR